MSLTELHNYDEFHAFQKNSKGLVIVLFYVESDENGDDIKEKFNEFANKTNYVKFAQCDVEGAGLSKPGDVTILQFMDAADDEPTMLVNAIKVTDVDALEEDFETKLAEAREKLGIAEDE